MLYILISRHCSHNKTRGLGGAEQRASARAIHLFGAGAHSFFECVLRSRADLWHVMLVFCACAHFARRAVAGQKANFIVGWMYWSVSAFWIIALYIFESNCIPWPGTIFDCARVPGSWCDFSLDQIGEKCGFERKVQGRRTHAQGNFGQKIKNRSRRNKLILKLGIPTPNSSVFQFIFVDSSLAAGMNKVCYK